MNLQVHVPQHARAEIFFRITNGISGAAVPSWQDNFSDTERWEIVRYLQALASGKA